MIKNEFNHFFYFQEIKEHVGPNGSVSVKALSKLKYLQVPKIISIGKFSSNLIGLEVYGSSGPQLLAEGPLVLACGYCDCLMWTVH